MSKEVQQESAVSIILVFIGLIIILLLVIVGFEHDWKDKILHGSAKFEKGQCITNTKREDWQAKMPYIYLIDSIGHSNYRTFYLSSWEYRNNNKKVPGFDTDEFIETNKKYRVIDCPRELLDEYKKVSK